MRAAIIRYAAGDPTKLPYRVTRQLVAARLGQLPSAIDAMAADDFIDATIMAGLTGLVSIGGTSE